MYSNEITNEAANRIKIEVGNYQIQEEMTGVFIRLVGPKSTSENYITTLEAKEIYEGLEKTLYPTKKQKQEYGGKHTCYVCDDRFDYDPHYLGIESSVNPPHCEECTLFCWEHDYYYSKLDDWFHVDCRRNEPSSDSDDYSEYESEESEQSEIEADKK